MVASFASFFTNISILDILFHTLPLFSIMHSPLRRGWRGCWPIWWQCHWPGDSFFLLESSRWHLTHPSHLLLCVSRGHKQAKRGGRKEGAQWDILSYAVRGSCAFKGLTWQRQYTDYSGACVHHMWWRIGIHWFQDRDLPWRLSLFDHAVWIVMYVKGVRG